MSIPRRQHIIPQMLLKRFSDPDGYLHVFDKRFPDKGIQKRTPKNLFVERDLFTIVEDSGIKDFSVEADFLSRLEGQAGEVIEKIVRAARKRKLPSMSSKETRIFAEFFCILFFRLPEINEEIMEHMRQETCLQIEQETKSRPLGFYERKLMGGGKEAARLLRNASNKALPITLDDNFIFEGIANMHLCTAVVWRPKPKRALAIGSVPFFEVVQ